MKVPEMLIAAAAMNLAQPRYSITRSEHHTSREQAIKKRRNRMRRKMAKASQRRNRA